MNSNIINGAAILCTFQTLKQGQFLAGVTYKAVL